MLHLTLRVPTHLLDEVVELMCNDETITNVSVDKLGFRKPTGARVEADVAREGGNRVITSLRELDLHHDGSITVSEPDAVFSRDAERAEEAAPGSPEDGVVWDLIENTVAEQSRLSFVFVAFLSLATLIAGAGRLLDQPILIIGAMVVGPEFLPVAAICVGLVRPRPRLVKQGLVTLSAGFAIAIAIATPLWFLAHGLDAFTSADAAHGPRTDFIVQPNLWSLVIALLAGIAGTLSLTTEKSGPLVGVFISITTVPAVGTIALCIGAGIWSEVPDAALQLGVNLAGLVVAGTATLLAEKLLWRRIPATRKPHAHPRRRPRPRI